ncbi:MAG: HAMP domain-containing histidine kinase [Bacteroidaceae bacterium]|nr:HAMP domain-containing histidine kinase [Bacteroidaceae bacterium]
MHYILCLLCLIFLASCGKNSAEEGRLYRVGVMHSYDRYEPCYKEFDQTLEEEFAAAGLNVQLYHFYTNNEDLELDALQVSENMEKLGKLDIDLLVTEGDVAAYHSILVHKKYGSHWPDVMCGLTVTDWNLLRSDPNLYIWYSDPNYRWLAMEASRMLRCRRVLVELDHHLLDSLLRCELHEAFSAAPFIDNIDLDKPLPMKDEEVEGRLRDSIMVMAVSYERPDSNRIATLQASSSLEDMRKLVYVGFTDVQLQVKRDLFSNETITRSGRPQFTCLPYDFGQNKQFLVGYFPTMEDQARDAASTAIRLLKGEKSGVLMHNLHRPKAHMDYEAMLFYGLKYEDYADRYHIMNVPFVVEHNVLAHVFIVFVLLLLSSTIFGLSYSYHNHLRKGLGGAGQVLNVESLSLLGREFLSFRCLDGVIIELNRSSDGSFTHADHITMSEFSQMVHEDYAVQRRRLFASFEVPGYYSVNLRMTFDETESYQWWRIRYVVTQNGDHIIVEGILMKVEREKQREEDYEQEMHHVEEMREKENFLNKMDHEIRTPMNGILGFCQLLANHSDLTLEERTDLSRNLRKASNQLSELVQEILTYSRIESGRMKYNMETRSVNDLMDNLAVVFQSKFNGSEICDEEGKEMPSHLSFCYAPGTSGLSIYVDSVYIQQVLSHLMTNAIKFTKRGDIRFGWTYSIATHEVSLFVEDSGVGISSEQMVEMWKPFWKKDNFKAGLGLGLSICNSMANSMGGRMEVESTVGRGSRFSVVFKECMD